METCAEISSPNRGGRKSETLLQLGSILRLASEELKEMEPLDCSREMVAGDTKILFTRCGGDRLEVEDFDFLRIVGHGSYGEVELWRHETTAKTYAAKSVNLKQLSGHEEALVLQELRLLRSLEHPHLAVCWRAWGMHSVLVMLLTYYPGGTIEDELKCARGCTCEEDVGRWLCQLLSALRFLHAHNVIHRDVCPANIFLSENHCEAVLGDLGACRVLASADSVAKTPMGHLKYLSPEMFEGQEFGGKTDIWSLGVVLRQLLGTDAGAMPTCRLPGETHAGSLQEVMNLMLQTDAGLRPSAAALCELPDLNACWPQELPRIAPDVSEKLSNALWQSALKLGAVISKIPENDVPDANAD